MSDSNIDAIKQLNYTDENITTTKPIHIKNNALYVTGWAGWSSKSELGAYPNETARYGGANENGHIYNASKGVGNVYACGLTSHCSKL